MSRGITYRFAGLKLWQIDAVGIGACAALAALWYAIGVSPLASARAERQRLDTAVSEMQAEAGRLASLERAQRKALAAERSKLDASSITLAPADQINQRVGDLNALAAASELRVDEIKPGAPVSHERYTSVPIVVSGQGTYHGVTAFLHQLRAKFPDIGLPQFELRGEPGLIDRPARYSLSLVWYAAPPGSKNKK